MLEREDGPGVDATPGRDVNKMYGGRCAGRLESWHSWRRCESSARSLRPNQIKTFSKAPAFFREGKLRAIVKKPPASGKTTTFAGFIAALEESAWVLIPGKSLRTDTVDTINYEIAEGQKRPGRGAKKAPEVFLIEPGKDGKTTTEQVREIVRGRRKHEKFVIVMTYQGALSLANNDPALLDRLLDYIGLKVSDESHRALGTQTRKEMEKANREGFQDCVSTCMQFLSDEAGAKSKLEALFTQQPAGSEEVSLLERAFRIVVTEMCRGQFPEVQGGARTSKMNRIARILVDAIQEDDEDTGEETAGASRPSDAIPTFESVDELYAYISTNIERLTEGSLEEILQRKQRPIACLYVTATPELAVKDVARTYGAEILDSDTFTDIEAEGTIIIPRRVGVGEAVYRTEKASAKTTVTEMARLAAEGKFIMRDGRSVKEAVSDRYVEEWKRCAGYLPAIARCSSIEEAAAVTEHLCKLGPTAIRCTSGNAKHPEGMHPDEAKRRIQLPPEHPDRIDVVVTVRQVGEGWNVTALRCALMYAFVRNAWEVIQFIGRIMRQLEEGSVLPPKTLDNTCIFEPDFFVETVKKREDEDGAPSEKEGVGAGSSGTGGNGAAAEKRKRRSSDEVFCHPNSLAMLVQADEVEASLAVERGLDHAVRVTFNPKSVDDIRVLLGSVDRLVVNGAPINLKATTFYNEQFDWAVSGSRLTQHQCPDATDGFDAARQLAMLLWEKEARVRIFNPKDPEHIAAILKSPRNAMRKGVVSLSAFYEARSCPERGWDFKPRELSDRCFGEGMGGLPKLRELITSTWGAVKSIRQPGKSKPTSWGRLAGSPEVLASENFYPLVFREGDWSITGWLMAEEWAPDLKFEDDRVGLRMARHFFPTWTPPPELEKPKEVVATEPTPTAPIEAPSVFGKFRCPLPERAAVIQAENDFKAVGPPERDIDYPDVLEKLLASRYLAKPNYVVHPFDGKGSTSVACFCRVLDYEWVITGSDERIAKQWAARQMVRTLLDRRALSIAPFQFREDLIRLETREYADKHKEVNETVRTLHRVVANLGMRIPIGFVTDSTVKLISDSEPEFVHTVHLIVGDYFIVGHGPTPYNAYGAAARLALRRIQFDGHTSSESDEIGNGDPGLSFTGPNTDLARMEVKIRCSHDLRFPIVLLDERTRRDAAGWHGEVKIGDLHGSGVAPLYRPALAQANTDLLHKIGGPYRATPRMPGDDFAAASKHPELIRTALSNPRGTLLKYLQAEFGVHPKFVVSPHGDDGEAFCEVRVPLMVNDVRLFGIVQQSEVREELDLLSVNCLRMLADNQALRGRTYTRVALPV